MKSEVIMQLNLIDYKELTQTVQGMSQLINDQCSVISVLQFITILSQPTKYAVKPLRS